MRHVSEGRLRRLSDDPYSITDREQVHLDGCGRCQERLHKVVEDARHAGAVLQWPVPAIDVRAAYAAFGDRQRRAGRARLGWRWALLLHLGWRRPAAGLGIALGMSAVIALTPLADSLHQLFQPQQVQPVAFSPQDVSSLKPLASYGTVTWPVKPRLVTAASAGAAAQTSGLPRLSISSSSLPTGISGQAVTYKTLSPATAIFTFSAAKARSAAVQAGQPVPSFPSGTDGSSVVAQTGAGEMAVYGDLAQLRQIKGQDPRQALSQVGPVLALGEMKAPNLYSSGLSVDQLKEVLLAQPGLTAQARAAIQALNNPAGTLLVPFPVDQASAHQVTVQGVSGTAFGDNTGLGAAVIWEKNGVVRCVAGTVSMDQALALAGNLP